MIISSKIYFRIKLHEIFHACCCVNCKATNTNKKEGSGQTQDITNVPIQGIEEQKQSEESKGIQRTSKSSQQPLQPHNHH